MAIPQHTRPAERAEQRPPHHQGVGGSPPHDQEIRLSETGGSRRRLLYGLVELARPRQWTKNVLVFAAPAAARSLHDSHVLALTTAAFLCFCLAASGTYYLNDVCDVEADRLHPRKRLRPLAAKTVPVGLARGLGLGLLAACVALAAVAVGLQFTLVLVLYIALMLAYSAYLKRVPVIELGIVASGFVFRAVAGGVASGIPISQWFLLVISFSSLFVVVGKRLAEHMALGECSAGHRKSLGEYSPGFLRYVGAISSAVAIIAYCLWAFTRLSGGMLWYELSIVPFVLGILSYALRAERGLAGAPEEVFLTDRTLQLLGLVWVALFLTGVYAV